MAQTIAAVTVPHVEHGILIDLKVPVAVQPYTVTGNGVQSTLTFTELTYAPFTTGDVVTFSGFSTGFNGPFTVISCSTTQVTVASTYVGTAALTSGQTISMNKEYNISNCYKSITVGSKNYIAQGGFLDVADIQGDLQNTNNEINMGLSAIPSNLVETVLGQQIKGSEVRIYRVFFDSESQQVRNISGVDQVFLRFNGVISNYSIQEDISNPLTGGDLTYTISLSCSSIFGVLENRISGRRTNSKSYQTFYNEQFITSAITTDPSLSRVEILRNASFDFGKPV